MQNSLRPCFGTRAVSVPGTRCVPVSVPLLTSDVRTPDFPGALKSAGQCCRFVAKSFSSTAPEPAVDPLPRLLYFITNGRGETVMGRVDFIWDLEDDPEGNYWHICVEGHGVTREEVEEVLVGNYE